MKTTNLKRGICLLLCAILLCSLPVAANAEEPVASGACGAEGDNILWSVDSDGVLTLRGEGAMADYMYDVNGGIQVMPPELVHSNAPWKWYAKQLRAVEIDERITHIGDGAFAGCYALERAAIPAGVQTIGEGAFANCYSLCTACVPEGVARIEDAAFLWCGGEGHTVFLPRSVEFISEGAFVLPDWFFQSVPQQILYTQLRTWQTVPTICYQGSEAEWAAVENLSGVTPTFYDVPDAVFAHLQTPGEHAIEIIGTEPTCEGYGGATCFCASDGWAAIKFGAEPLGHIDEDGDGFCDRCGFSPDAPANGSFFARLFSRLLRLLQTILQMFRGLFS